MISTARNRLWLPRLALAGCVRAAMLRDTTDAALAGDDLLSHLPASPLMSLSWWFRGAGFIREGREWLPMPGRFVVGGPFTHPTLTANDGPVHGMMLMFMPDALQALTGIDVQALVNRLVDATTVLPPDWIAMCEAVQAAPDDDTRLALIEAFVLPRWQALGRDAMPHRYQAWMQALALRAATSTAGRSLRQLERRIKRWAGLPLRELRVFARAERAFLEGREALQQGTMSWAELADQGGYADQSHLCRESRRITGFAPDELRRRMAEDEAFWAYRLWG